MEVAADGRGLVGHAGLVLPRKMADIAGLTAGLANAFRAGRADKLDRGVVVGAAAVAIVGGATNFSQVGSLLAHHRDTFGITGSDTTVWRTLEEMSEARVSLRVARARARARKKVWAMLAARAQGFPTVTVAGKPLTGWVLVDVDATIVEAHSEKEGAAGHFKGGYGHHPLLVWCSNTGENLRVLLRNGNAGSDTAADHVLVLDDAFAQLPDTGGYSRVLVRIDGAGASHETVNHLLALSTTRRKVAFTIGWTITKTDEDAIAALPDTAWESYLDQDGTIRGKKLPGGGFDQYGHVAELTGLNGRISKNGWPAGLRLIARRVPITARDQAAGKLTAREKSVGWKYAITATNISARGLAQVPGAGHAQFLDAVHRQHANVEDRVRTGKSLGLGHLPSKLLAVNQAWLDTAAIGTDLDAWTRLLGLADHDDLTRAEPATMRARIYSAPARLARHARKTWLRFEATLRDSTIIATAWTTLTGLAQAT
ncbi:IS1380 family transposase [Promicromonospora sp. NPDC023987]|uniref:IS1380 family transposase n=1 Tax=Promicromonospora sp. NPDC023987 TaxID=3155360 RepID=UPI0033E818D4